MSKIPEETIREMERLYNAMMEEQRKMKALEADAIAALKKTIEKHYPEIYHLESEGYRELENAIWRAVDKFVTDVNDITYTRQIK